MRVIVLGLLTLVISASAHADQVSDFAQQAKIIATTKWHPDARLVSIQVSGYGFDESAMSAGGPLKSNNTPTLAYFWFYSPTADKGKILHVSQQFNFGPDQKDLLKQRPDLARMRWREMSDYSTTVPWQNGIPDNVMTVTDAVALAQKAGLAEDCAGTNPHYGCGNITRADLHVYIVGANQLLPVWRLTLGQGANAREIVRLVNAASGKLITNCTVPGASVAATERTNLYLECR